MRDWIAVIIAVLGVLLVLAGATLIVLRALPSAPPAPDLEAAPVSRRLVGALKESTPADRLILWGIVLLVLAAVAAGAITFNLGAAGGATPATK